MSITTVTVAVPEVKCENICGALRGHLSHGVKETNCSCAVLNAYTLVIRRKCVVSEYPLRNTVQIYNIKGEGVLILHEYFHMLFHKNQSN